MPCSSTSSTRTPSPADEARRCSRLRLSEPARRLPQIATTSILPPVCRSTFRNAAIHGGAAEGTLYANFLVANALAATVPADATAAVARDGDVLAVAALQPAIDAAAAEHGVPRAILSAM